MSIDQSASAPEQDVPEIEVRGRRGISIIWLIPVVAGAIAIWLAYTTISEKGPVITITFKTAEGLEAGKTKIKFRDVEVGQVETVTLLENLTGVVVTANLMAGTEPHLNEKTRFWVVRPRLGAGGVSGLDTLVSGSYIEVDLGDGEKATLSFTGLETPPVISSDVPGKQFTLIASQKGSLGLGAPIHYRGVEVGEILGEKIDADGRGVTFLAFVKSPYDNWVTKQTRFWNVSGFEIDMGADGVKVRTASLQAILSGGIAFETPIGAGTEPADEGTKFLLHDNKGDIAEKSFRQRIPFLLYFEGSVRGLSVGAPVELQGIRIGTVRNVELEMLPAGGGFRVPVTITIEPERVRMGNDSDREPYQTAEELIRRGLRAQLRSGSLLTGQLYVALDFFPAAPPAELKYKGVHPELPTLPSEIEHITRSAKSFLDDVAALPLDQLVEDLRRTVQAVEALVDSAELKQSVRSLDSALLGVDKLVQSAGKDIGPMLANLRKASAAADDALGQASALIVSVDGMVGEDAQLRYDLNRMLREFSEAAASIRVLADYLERNPDSLLRGKAGE